MAQEGDRKCFSAIPSLNLKSDCQKHYRLFLKEPTTFGCDEETIGHSATKSDIVFQQREVLREKGFGRQGTRSQPTVIEVDEDGGKDG